MSTPVNNEFVEEIEVVTWRVESSGPGLRGMPTRDDWRSENLVTSTVKVSELAGSIQVFLEQVGRLLTQTPNQLGAFEFSEFEISAGVTASGHLTLFGVAGAEAGLEGGLKFVFKKRPQPDSSKSSV